MIPEHRTSTATLEVTGASGAPLAGTDVEVSLVSHEFGFGNIGFELLPLLGEGEPSPEAREFTERFTRVFNMATLPFYWGRYEPREGEPDHDRMERAARHLASHGVHLKGHPLVWHTVQPDWLLGRPLEEVERLLRARVRDITSRFAGLVDHFDAINEVVIMPVFDNGDNAVTPLAAARGRVEMVRLAVDEARAGNPAVKLVLNDFDLSERYEQLVEEVLSAGIRLDAIGLQTHMHQGYRGEEWVLDKVERFARFGLPLQFTETTLVSGDLMPPEIVDLNDYQVPEWPTTPEGEQRQADELERHYRALFGHPAVESLTYWGLLDQGAWLGAPAGLVRLDGTVKPAYERLDQLINHEWGFAPTTMRTDADGHLHLTGPTGRWRVSVDGREAQFTLDGSPVALTL